MHTCRTARRTSRPRLRDPQSIVLTHLEQVLVDGPSEDESKAVPRHSAPLSHVSLLPQVIEKLPRGIGHGPLTKKWKEADVEGKFDGSDFAKARQQRQKRRQLNDFERFKVMRMRKQVSAT